MYGDVMKNKMEYMNELSKGKTYNYIQVSYIDSAIKEELKDRKLKGLIINGRTKAGRELMNKRVSEIANKNLQMINFIDSNMITAEDVQLYKKCYYQEYSDRTGRCAYGFKELRKRLGYDEETGREIAS